MFVALIGVTATVLSYSVGAVWIGSKTVIGAHDGSVIVVDFQSTTGSPCTILGAEPGFTIGTRLRTLTIQGAGKISSRQHTSVLWTWPLGVAGFLLCAAVFVHVRNRRDGANPDTTCVHCGYEVAGLSRCPECGRPVATVEKAK